MHFICSLAFSPSFTSAEISKILDLFTLEILSIFGTGFLLIRLVKGTNPILVLTFKLSIVDNNRSFSGKRTIIYKSKRERKRNTQ